MKERVDFLIACGRNSESYVQFLIQTVEKTASSTDFRFLLGINDNYVSRSKLENISSEHNIEILDCRSDGAGSYGHGEALDKLSKYVKTDFFIICDCDVAFLTKDWDKLLLDKFGQNDSLAAIGSEYDGKKYMNFPNVVMCMLKTQVIKDCKVSFLPSMLENRKIAINSENSKIYGREIGEVIDLDTGWQLCYNLVTNGHEGLTLPLRRKSAGDECFFLTEGVRGEEYILETDPICSHVGRSFSRSFDNPITVTWRNRVREWLG